MKRERFLPAFLIGFFCLLALSSCVSESFLSERVSIEPPQTDRPEAVMLWKQMQEQPGSAERLGRALHKNTPLYEHTITASSPDFGVYYLIPYTDDKNEVKGCLIYPVDEDKPLEERDITGTLGNACEDGCGVSPNRNSSRSPLSLRLGIPRPSRPRTASRCCIATSGFGLGKKR